MKVRPVVPDAFHFTKISLALFIYCKPAWSLSPLMDSLIHLFFEVLNNNMSWGLLEGTLRIASYFKTYNSMSNYIINYTKMSDLYQSNF